MKPEELQAIKERFYLGHFGANGGSVGKLLYEIERLKLAMEEIDKHVDSRLENVNDAIRKERETYTDHTDTSKRKRSVRVQNALLEDKSSLRQVQTIVRQALEG